ncbi:MAG: Na-K-Cl cotransporter [Myxococcota bacterium]
MAEEPGNASAQVGVPRVVGRFGTFAGVFTPSILTILGVVMYLRLGWVTGQAGLGGTLLIVTVAHLISFATGLSIASIATDRTVGAGGAYFMISRALGAPAGAAIGIPLFFAQALSVTFYIVGFTEALLPLIPERYADFFDAIFISTAVNILLTMISLKSADLAIKTQYVVMAAIVVSLVSFFGGTTPEFPRTIEWTNETGAGFGEVFAVFFPAVTGIMAGVSMSGDLRDPRRSIPRGTLLAILVGFVVYCAFPIWLSLNYSNDGLIADLDAVWTIAWWSPLIFAGVFGATLSSAIGSILTAPRTLQALAFDGLVPRVFGRGSGPDNEPRIGIMLTFVLSQTGIFLGSLDAIAPVLTMFFLATYGVTNLAFGLQQWSGNPSFRPSFKVPSVVGLGGGAACFYVMSILNLPAMVAALVFSAIIFVLVSRRALDTTYGDARHGIWSAVVRYALHRLRKVEWHPRNWRPNLLILGGDPRERPHLLELGNTIVQDRGIVTYFHLLTGKVGKLAPQRKELFQEYDAEMSQLFPSMFYRVDIVDDVYEGAVHVAQSYGVGSVECNTVMAGWPQNADRDRNEAYIQMLRELTHLDRSLTLVKLDEAQELGNHDEIHVWWGGFEGNGGLMLLLAFLIMADRRWRNAKVTVLTIVSDEAERVETERNLQRILEAARLEGEARVILRGKRTIPQVMGTESAHADLAIVGFRLPPEGTPAKAFFERMNTMLERLPTTLLVHSARSFEGEPVLFDDDHAPAETSESPEVSERVGSTSTTGRDPMKVSSPGQLPAGAPLPPSPFEGEPVLPDLAASSGEHALPTDPDTEQVPLPDGPASGVVARLDPTDPEVDLPDED